MNVFVLLGEVRKLVELCTALLFCGSYFQTLYYDAKSVFPRESSFNMTRGG